jgi:putative endonuclease
MHRLVRPKHVKFFYVYVLKRLNKDVLYVGFTSDLKHRFIEHNNKEELSTKKFAPYDLIHYEAYKNENDAKRREEYLKITKGRTTLRTMLREYFKNFDAITS